MNQRTRVILGVLVVLAIAGAVFWIRSGSTAPNGRLALAGDVRSDIRTISAPAIVYPTPDYTVGIPKPAGASAKPGPASAKRPASSSSKGLVVVAGMLTHVYVTEGDTVKAGDIVARFDTQLLELGVQQAKTASRKQHKDVAVLGKTIDKLGTASSKLATARGQIATAKAGLIKGRAALLKARKQVLAQRAMLLDAKAHRPQLQALLASLMQQAAQLPPNKVPAALKKQIKDLTTLLFSIDPGLKAISGVLKTIDTNLAKIAKGMAALPAAQAKINTAAKQLADAKVTLRGAKDVLSIVAKGSSIGIRLANARLGFAEVRTPVAGVVTFARRAGTAAMVGAPLVRVRPDGVQEVDTYLTAEQAAIVQIGSEADVAYDSSPGTVLHGKVSRFGASYVFPPTSFPTQVVHMTRALKVTITLDPGSSIPPGTPVDLSIQVAKK